MSKIDQNYHKLLEEILWTGYKYPDPKRTDVERIEIPSCTFKHDFENGFPAISTKKLQYKQIVTELIWFLKGDTNIKYLVDNGCNIWNKDAYNYYVKKGGTFSAMMFRSLLATNKNQFASGIKDYQYGDLGPVYGKQWRNFNGEDQILRLIKNLKEQPMATDHIVNAWNAGELKDMALPPCHYGFQVLVRPLSKLELNMMKQKVISNVFHIDKLKCNKVYLEKEYEKLPKYGFELHWTQRSVDTFLGLPYNIASYATLALILEKITGHKALGIQGDLKKVHLYDNSIDAVNEQLSRSVNTHKKCELKIDDNWIEMVETQNLTIDEILSETEIDDFELIDYESDPTIRVEMLERDE